MTTAVFAVLLMGLGIDFSIHLLNRFTEELERTNNLHQAFRYTARHTGKAIVLGTLTTATAFGALYFSQTEALHQMGIILAMGLVITMLCVFLILPALVTLRLKRGSLKEKLKDRARFSMMGALGRQSVRFAGVITIMLLAFCAVFAILAPGAEINSDIHELQPTTVPAYQWMEVVKANFNYTEDYILCIAHSYDGLQFAVAALGKLPQVMSVESVLDYLPANQTEKLTLFEAARQLHPSFTEFSWLNVSAMHWQHLPEHVRGNWVAPEGNDFQFLIRIKAWGNIWDEEYREALVEDIRTIIPDVASRAIMIPKLIDVMTDDVIQVSIFAALPILVIVYLGFRRRSPIYALLAVIPVLFAIGGLLALSGPLGIPLNLVSIMMIPLVIGIGVDDSIHILHRYKEEGLGSLPRVIQHTGKAIFLTTATTTLAFSSFLVAEHPGLRSMGQVPVLGLVLCFLAAVIFLPALVAMVFERRATDERP
jgi:predicted RND superfamily exporter protein